MSFTVTPALLGKTVWAKQAWQQIIQPTAFGHMMNSGVIYRPDNFDGNTQLGQNIVYPYVGKLNQAGLGEGSTMVGNEEALNIGTFGMRLGMTRIAVKNPNDEDTLEATRVDFNFAENTRAAIAEAIADKMDFSLFNQLAGNTATSMTLNGITYTGTTLGNVTGWNTVNAPSSTRIIRAGSLANDQALTSANRMTLSLVDYAMESLMNTNQQFKPLRSNALAELWISYEQFVDLKQDTDSPVQWYINAQAEAAGGNSEFLRGPRYYKNDMRPVGMYAGVEIFVSPRVSFGVNSGTNAQISTVRRAVLVGRDALSFASRAGKGYANDTQVPFVFKTQLEDFEYWKAIEGRAIYGLSKNTPTIGQDIGTMVISTYAAPHV